jgi:hypothetical protein
VNEIRVLCPSCRVYQRAKSESKSAGRSRRGPIRILTISTRALDRLGEAGGEAFAIAVARGDLWAAEGFAGAELDLNDPEEK